MPAVLTTDSDVTCPHKKGRVTVTSTTRLSVNGAGALLTPVIPMPISDCPMTSPPNIPCTLVSKITSGSATKLSVGGVAVLLESLVAPTNGTPSPTGGPNVLATANQTRLRTN